MSIKFRSRASLVASAAVVSLALACADSGPIIQDDTPLAGLTKVAASNDSTGNTPVEPPTTAPATPGNGPDTGTGNPGSGIPAPAPGPGAVRGYVLGAAEPGTPPGTDTLATSPRIADVRVTAYPQLEEATGNGQPKTGPAAASVLTDSKGEFKLPSLDAGKYVVTFTPAEGSKYRGVYITGTIHSRSGDYPWWIILPRK